MNIARLVSTVALSVAALGVGSAALADGYPRRPVRVIISFLATARQRGVRIVPGCRNPANPAINAASCMAEQSLAGDRQ
jgi:hypothetical protein